MYRSIPESVVAAIRDGKLSRHCFNLMARHNGYCDIYEHDRDVCAEQKTPCDDCVEVFLSV